MTEQHSKRRAGNKASPASGPPRRRQAVPANPKRGPTSGGIAGSGSRAARRRADPSAGKRGLRASKKKLPADPKSLAQGVFAHVDPEGIAVGVLKGDDERLKLRVWELLLAYAYGKPAQYVEATGPEGGPIRMVWDIPAPERERAEEDKS